MEFSKKYQKREVIISIGATKHRNKIIEHCNECYRIYQIPYSNLNANYDGGRNELAYVHNCWEIYHGKLLDVEEVAIKEKMDLVKKIAHNFIIPQDNMMLFEWAS
uniref:Phage protein n=1 Tax=Brugia pahangi TaxID=6280 RepID=A0A0N4TU60_BRUPA